MASGEKISILIMRDDAGVRRMRISPFWIKTAVWGVVFLAVAAALFAAGAMHYQGRVATSENIAQSAERQAKQARDRLARLDEIETVLRSKDLTELQTLLGSYNPDAAAWWKPAAGETPPAAPGPEKTEPGVNKIDLRKLFDKVDLTQAGVDNFKFKIENNKLAVNFDLSNLSPQSALAGKAELFLVGNDGALHPLKTEKDELNFQIQRFKQVAVQAPIPQGTAQTDIYGLKMVIHDPGGKTIYSAIYPSERQ
ncbi:hypothetical protein [Desulfolutivibrio sulfoxidireducens]|uniref:hypothetical protein n=1 Tax=Desulfolutivibrio sulfoxidireducens TaxID=2773299 RepID=UPI00159D57A9|nr:hypothetical protein [Desulfolutivibrio sulfoxidireducens]QLA17949.1 hypothetical protein GD605_18585 [Desulfolutivibrio sulfoxidireducens]QLA21526.1 hypothetical protein GD604_18200 [Desulfolutivibrio sulfoxidireducens]